MAQGELARLLGTYQVTVCRWEKGVRKVPFLLPLALKALEHEMTAGGGKNGVIGGVSGVQKAE
jgi:hypothetical protein